MIGFEQKPTWIINDTTGKDTHVFSLKAFYLLNTHTNSCTFKTKSKVRNWYINSLECNPVHCISFRKLHFLFTAVYFGLVLWSQSAQKLYRSGCMYNGNSWKIVLSHNFVMRRIIGYCLHTGYSVLFWK